MKAALLNSLTEAELALIRETKRPRMKELDEDSLVELHSRIRRARRKYATLYRREASARVAKQGGRGMARPQNRRNAGKAEIFEDALARVSRRLAIVAKQSAGELKAERLEAAARAGSGPAKGKPSVTKRAAKAAPSVPVPGKSPSRKKREASTLAAGARRQSKRDGR